MNDKLKPGGWSISSGLGGWVSRGWPGLTPVNDLTSRDRGLVLT